MRSKRIGTFTIGLLILVSLVGLLLANQIAPTSTISAQAISTSSNATDAGYVLFVFNRTQFYSYQLGSGSLAPLTLPSTWAPYLSFPNLNSIDWSNINHAFLVTDGNVNSANTIYRISDNQISPVPITLQALSSSAVPQIAQWGPDEKSIVLTYYLPDPRGPGVNGPTYYFLAVYTRNGGFRTLISPDIIDADGHPTMNFTDPERDTVYGTPKWSPDGKYIFFAFSRDLNIDDSMHAEITGNFELINTDCLSDSNKRCKISILPQQNQSEGWSDFSWLPDSKHLIFACESSDNIGTPDTANYVIQDKQDLCMIASDGSEYKHLSLPGLVNIQSTQYLKYALSPDGKTLAYTQDDRSVYVYEFSTDRLVDKVQIPPSSDNGPSILIWVPIQSIQIFTQLPTPTPLPATATPSLKLSLKPVCGAANSNSLHQDVWHWYVVNSNSVPVAYSMDWYDFTTHKVEKVIGMIVPAAKNGVPTSVNPDAWTQPGPNKVHLYVDGILQDEQSVPPLPCPGSTATPTLSPSSSVTLTMIPTQ